MPVKLLKMYVRQCGQCPYCQYDDGSSRGWDCMNPRTDYMRLVDDDGGEQDPVIEIPDWCPLDTADVPARSGP